MPTEKTPVVDYLYKQLLAGRLPPDGVVRRRDIVHAMGMVRAKLSIGNPANFFKDIIRKTTANQHWPANLTAAGVTGRQRYGGERVFEFVPFKPGQTVPFPDNYLPSAAMPVYDLQSATIPFAARQLGRREESWLMQVTVALRVVESHLSLFSPLRGRLRDVTHLQMSMKTQPEIDAVFLVSHSSSRRPRQGQDLYSFVTCEAKQIGERILEDQIREQVNKAFEQTDHLQRPEIRAVKPIAVQVRDFHGPGAPFRGIYVVEFQRISRTAFNKFYKPVPANMTRLYDMPLDAASTAAYRLTPTVLGVNA